MVFTTNLFLFYFLPLVLVLYYGLPWLYRRLTGLWARWPTNDRWKPGDLARAGDGPASSHTVSSSRNGFLLVASYVFYGWWNPWFLPLIALVTVANFAGGRYISGRARSERQRWWGLTAAVAASLGALGFFKYFNFFEANLNHVLAWLGTDTMRVLAVTLPMGISFYTFQALSYTIDVYRRDAPPARSLIDFATYIALFPQLVAGPIIRYNTVAEQLVRRHHHWDRFASGVAIFILGFAKKILLANPAGTLADAAFGAQSLSVGHAWFGVVAYAFQIYFDFSGYSDMAVGLGRMLGLEFMKNFNAPYRADSITDFWRRWHISLSTFLRDYLYIPLGGNRRGPRRTYVNLTIVMLLGGLWHGANWTFVIWGAYHGLLLAFERSLGKRSVYRGLPRGIRVAVTFGLVLVSWVFFRSANLAEATGYLGVMFGGGHQDPASSLLAAQLVTPSSLALMAICTGLVLLPCQAHDWADSLTWPKALALGPVFCGSVMAMFAQSFSPFLYFQF